MPENDEAVWRWHAAAGLAPFSFYEASNGSERWAGGFAGDGSLVEVISLVDGDEVSVQTSRTEPELPRHLGRRAAVHDLLWGHVLGGDGDLDLPYSVTIEADDRVVSVDGEIHHVPGMRIAGDRQWVGTLRLGDVTVKITTPSSAALELRICSDRMSLPELPPELHCGAGRTTWRGAADTQRAVHLQIANAPASLLSWETMVECRVQCS